MHNLFLEKTITRFLFNVKIDKPVEPGKRNPPVCLDDSHSSVVNCSINKCQIYYKTLGLTTTTDNVTRMTAYFKLVPVVKSVVSGSNPVTPEEFDHFV